MGTTVACPACGYPNLGIDIWCQRCRTPLEWNGLKPAPVADQPAPVPVVAPASPVPIVAQPVSCPGCGIAAPPGGRYCRHCGRAMAGRSTQLGASSRRRSGKRRGLTLPRITLPAIAWPRLTLPALAVPRLRLPRVPKLAWLVGAVLVVLLVAPLAYVLLPGRNLAARQSATTHLPSTSGATPANTPQAAAIPGVEAKTGLHYSSGKCASTVACLTVANQTLGLNAAAVTFSTASAAGRQCVGYVYQSAGGWHFFGAVCGLPGQLSPLVGHDATVRVPGNCANLRNTASLTGGVVACLHNGTTVRIDGGPTYADSRLWWHEKQGWMAHEFLIGP
jgi:hypothetical protein